MEVMVCHVDLLDLWTAALRGASVMEVVNQSKPFLKFDINLPFAMTSLWGSDREATCHSLQYNTNVTVIPLKEFPCSSEVGTPWFPIRGLGMVLKQGTVIQAA